MEWVPDLHKTAELHLTADVAGDLEQLAEHVHNVWCAKRLAEGWKYGPERRSREGSYRSLVPYAQLPPDVLDYDREMVAETIKMLVRLGYRVTREPGVGTAR